MTALARLEAAFELGVTLCNLERLQDLSRRLDVRVVQRDRTADSERQRIAVIRVDGVLALLKQLDRELLAQL